MIPPFAIVAVIAVVGATLVTIRGNGPLSAVGIAVLLLIPVTVISVFALGHPEPDSSRLLVGIGTAIFYGIPLGVGSFVLGYVIRTYVRS